MGSTIALLTDFGVKDTYVGVMKAVMCRICPDADFIDLTHAIAPQNIHEAALALLGAYRYFPPGTIFLVVVDPGVGSTRQPIAAQTDAYTFVAPDNGVLSYALAEARDYRAVELREAEFHLLPVSQTFHGRDIFAPTVAHLANGIALDRLGPALADLTTLPLPRLDVTPTVITGEVMHIDHFGNIITSIGQLRWDGPDLTLQPRFAAGHTPQSFVAGKLRVILNGHQVEGVRQSYSAVESGELLALVGSSGFLELAVNQGSGAAHLKATIGDRVEVRVS